MIADNSVLVSGVEPGEVLAGKYRIDRLLGAGGMGVVLAAHHVGLDQNVAIKFLLPQALCNAEAVARFSREAKAVKWIKSAHVARVADVGTLESGAPYMVTGSSYETGWNSSWNASPAADTPALVAALKCASGYPMWTDTAAGNENRPIICINW